MRAYLRVDPELAEKKSSYPDGAFVAFVSALCAAEQQPHRGRFKTPKILRAYLGKHARWIRFLVAQHDLVELESGVLYVDGWDEWQEGDWKVSERVSRIRNRPKVTVGVTPDVTVGVTVATVNTPGNPPLTLPDSPQEQIANSRKRLATSNPPDPPSGGLLSAQTIEVIGWWCLKRGWQAVPPSKQREVYRDAAALASLGMEDAELLSLLDELWEAAAEKPYSLQYFWVAAQQRFHELTKVQTPLRSVSDLVHMRSLDSPAKAAE